MKYLFLLLFFPFFMWAENEPIAQYNILIDTRSENAYHGWKLNGEKRGGHIPGAISLPINEALKLDSASEMIAFLKEQDNIMIYGNNKKQSKKLVNILHTHGIKSSVYNMSFNEYAKNKALPLEKLPRYEKLIPAQFLNQLLLTEMPFKLFEVSWGDGALYKKGHIPTAIHINTDEVEQGPIWNYKTKKELKSFALKYGIAKDEMVVLYGDDSMGAFRVAVILMAMGVEDVRVLNGGFNAWKKENYSIEKGWNKPKKIMDFNGEFFSHSHILKTVQEAEELLKDENSQLISIRSREEFLGKTSGYTYIKPKGRIKNAIWGKAGSDAYHLEDYRNTFNAMKSEDAIKRMWKGLGINSEKHLSFYCGTGWRASEVFFYAYVMGLDNISLYDGGWLEWSLDETRAIINENQR